MRQGGRSETQLEPVFKKANTSSATPVRRSISRVRVTILCEPGVLRALPRCKLGLAYVLME